ncbi:unnamed protein product [Miscanthus lutarioriparius]|uniref:Uncharacterized protein n=1 Tax=Miscanthus lutarioriparius TaxID=422564 RepID=A0A811RE10_9POAL|nr:unnamed protein product [Miscanthus lutarioriparius]
MALAVDALSCRRPLPFRSRGWKLQSPVATWKHMQSRRLTEVITFAPKNTKRKRRSFQNESKGFVVGAPRTAVLQACTLTSGLLLAGGLLLRQCPELFMNPDCLPFAFCIKA